MQHQALFDEPEDHETDDMCEHEYGLRLKKRTDEPPMSQLLSWGMYDPPIRNDFIKNKDAYQARFKINKLGVEFISETRDKFSEPCCNKKYTKEQQIVKYLQHDNQRLIKKKL